MTDHFAQQTRPRDDEVQQRIRQSAIVFPYLMGPAVRRFGTMLLWKGQLTLSAGNFISPHPRRHFAKIGPATEGTDVGDLFKLVLHHAILGQTQRVTEVKALGPLQSRISGAFFVGPGTMSSYAEWEPWHDPCLSVTCTMLADTQILNAAAEEFVWRVYEVSLEHGADPDSPLKDSAPVIQYFVDRATQLGGPELLLAECALHRVALMTKEAGLSFVTDCPAALSVLAEVGRKIPYSDEHEEIRVQQLGFSLFDALVNEYVPSPTLPKATRLAELLDKRGSELTAARNRCLEAARNLVRDKPDGPDLEPSVRAKLIALSEEIRAVVEVDRESLRRLTERLAEDRGFWVAITGLLGSVIGGISGIVPAAAALTAFATLGTKALTASRERRELIQNSPWAVFYFLHRET